MCKTIQRLAAGLAAGLLTVSVSGITPVCAASKSDVLVLRVCSWEEYIDEGGWDDEELIDLDSRTVFSQNGIIADFEEWYYETYGKKIVVEYSTFGTNEELYSQLMLGDTYDLICPSDYMIMKLMAEGALEPLSEDFFDAEDADNCYTNGVSPFIRQIFEENEINGETWSKYAACYMWGITGIVYNPEEVSEEDASTWSILNNPDYFRQVTIKDNVRDAYFPTVAILKEEQLTDPEFICSEDYQKQLALMMNDVSNETIDAAEELLKEIRGNVYSFETDSGKADMVSGKVLANLQWSGDAVYSMDQAEEDDVYLAWAVPEECTNLWFDGWVMLKSGINGDAERRQAAEAFINFLSRPDNVVRNMYYIGYTSAIAGGEDPLVFEYAQWCYGAESDEDVVEYPLGYFFSGDNEDEEYILMVSAEEINRQISAQYPSQEEINRSAVMGYFNDAENAKINQMWINVRCFNFSQITAAQWRKAGFFVLGILAAVLCLIGIRSFCCRKKVRKTRKV